MQLRVFFFGLLEDRDVAISVLPEEQEILILSTGLGRVAGEGVRAAEAEMGQCPNGIANNDSLMVENSSSRANFLRADPPEAA